jgi:hypothetical protein
VYVSTAHILVSTSAFAESASDLTITAAATAIAAIAAAAAAGKLDQAQELSGHLAAAYPGNPSVNMLQAVLLAKSGKVSSTTPLCCRYWPHVAHL